MNTMRTAFVSLAVAGTAATALLAGPGLASAADGPYLDLNKTTVAPGDTVTVSAACDEGGVGMVGSEAFAPTGEDGPWSGNGGVAKFDETSGDTAQGTATIRSDAAPGTYDVGERCGGSAAGSSQITVTG